MIDKEKLPETLKSKVRWKHLKENIRTDFLEKWELDVLLQNVTYDYLKYIILFGWYTGCRKGEILNLRWSQINIHDGIVNLKETKSGIRRSIPLVDELREYFERKHKELEDKGKLNQNDVVWRKKNGSPIKTIDYQWKTSCIRSKLVDENGRWKKFHCLRRSFVRNSIKSGVSEKIICSIGGWETNSVFQRYNIVNEQDLIDGMKLINQKLSSMKTMEDVYSNEDESQKQTKNEDDTKKRMTDVEDLKKEMEIMNQKLSKIVSMGNFQNK
jgi:integrase